MRIIQLSLRSVHRVRVRTNKRQKINGLLSPRAEAGQENIETVHEPKPIQTASSPWGQGRRAMRDPHGPRTQVREGARAIKVSMSCNNLDTGYLCDPSGARTISLFGPLDAILPRLLSGCGTSIPTCGIVITLFAATIRQN